MRSQQLVPYEHRVAKGVRGSCSCVHLHLFDYCPAGVLISIHAWPNLTPGLPYVDLATYTHCPLIQMAWTCPSRHSAHCPRQLALLSPRHSTSFCRRLLCATTTASIAVPLLIPSSLPFSTPYSTTLGGATPIPASRRHIIAGLVFSGSQPPPSAPRLTAPFIPSPTKEQQ